MIKKQLKLIKSGDIEGYLINDIKRAFSKKQFLEFKKWIHGQTVGIFKG